MPDPSSPLVSRTSLKLLTLVLDAVGAPAAAAQTVTFCGLPAPTLALDSLKLLVSATPCDRPMFRDALPTAALVARHDVLLIRHGLHPEILDPVTVDVARATARRFELRVGLLPAIDDHGQLLLIPPARDGGTSVRVAPHGLRTLRRSPFNDADERHEALMRAARSIILRYRSP